MNRVPAMDPAGGARAEPGVDADAAAALLDDPEHGGEAQSGALALFLGALGHRIPSVHHEVHQYLLELSRIGSDTPELRPGDIRRRREPSLPPPLPRPPPPRSPVAPPRHGCSSGQLLCHRARAVNSRLVLPRQVLAKRARRARNNLQSVFRRRPGERHSQPLGGRFGAPRHGRDLARELA